MDTTLIIAGREIKAKLYKTLSAAQNYIKKHPEFEMIYYRAHEYYIKEKTPC